MWRLRRFRTWRRARFSPSFRVYWAIVFSTNPHLLFARSLIDTAHDEVAFETMSGWYNDHVPGGFMTAADARSIFRS